MEKILHILLCWAFFVFLFYYCLPGKQEIKYVQISVESYSYSHLIGLEDRVKSLKLAAAQSEMTNKENLGKQYAKVAEEAVSGWEKAAKQFDKMKHEFEAKLANLDQQLLRSAAENSALSRSLQERSSMVIQLIEEKAQAEAEIEMLKKNMSVRSAEVANKQHLEGVKKIAYLDVERQRLRGRVWRKLLGPTALAQVKLDLTTQTYDMEGVKKFAKLEAERRRLRDLAWEKLLGPTALPT
ncbi:hypothetical protein P3S67_011394 [Capsicum chacoense]